MILRIANAAFALSTAVSLSLLGARTNTGVALSTIDMKPINGLRHPAASGTTGWYIWCGATLSDAPDFFHPLCVDHLVERLPIVAKLLGLPPGYRFLIADGYEDVWFDESLLNV